MSSSSSLSSMSSSSSSWSSSSSSSSSSFSSSPSLYSFQLLKWCREHVLSPSSPRPRSGQKLVCFEEAVYSFGGFNPHIDSNNAGSNPDPSWILSQTGTLFKELWRYDVASHRWLRLDMHPFVPGQLASHGMVVDNDKLIVFGGTGAPFGLTTSKKVFQMEMKAREWSELKTTVKEGSRAPNALYGQGVAIGNRKLYVVGGTSGFDYFMDVHVLDLVTCEWQSLYITQGMNEEEPTPRYRHEIVVYEDKIVVFGGGSSLESHGFDLMPVFNLKSLKWTWVTSLGDKNAGDTEEEQLPLPRRCHSIVQRGKWVFMIGGYDGKTVFSSTWRVDLNTMQWTKIVGGDLPRPVYFHSSAITSAGKMVTFGGVRSISKNQRTKAVYTAWTTIPTLRAMCWEALNFYMPYMCQVEEDKLTELGIPRDLVHSLHLEGDQAA